MPTVKGKISRIVHENNGFVILRIMANGNPISEDGNSWEWEESSRTTEFCVKGNMMHPCLGIEYTFIGKIEQNKNYGPQMAFAEYSRMRPIEKKAIVEYLSYNCPGIGVKIANDIYDVFGDSSVEILKTSPALIASKVKISFEKAMIASEKLSDIEDSEQLKLQLSSLLAGTSVNKRQINTIIKKFGSNSPDIIMKEPYKLIEVRGIGFKTADSIAVKNGVGLESPERICACAEYVLKIFENGGGHTCAPYSVVLDRVMEEISLPNSIVEENMDKHIQIGSFVKINQYVYRRQMYDKEKNIAYTISILAQFPVDPVEPCIEGLDDEQAEAVTMATQNSVMLLTGAPGVGKTFTVTKICETFEGHSVALCAQTGKAARRITEITGKPATTIHSLLVPRMVSEDGDEDVTFSFRFGKNQKLECDVVIVDEASLLDIDLANSLFNAIRVGCRLIIVGDSHQLPSVGPGKILTSLIESGVIAHKELKKIKRQGANSAIVQVCHEIKNDMAPEINNTEGSDLFMFDCYNNDQTISMAIDLFTNRVPSKFGYKMSDIQIVAANKNPDIAISTFKINQEIQKRTNNNFNIDASERMFDKKNKICFRLGDRVINTKNIGYKLFDPEDNNYFPTEEVTVVNGDIGTIKGVLFRNSLYDQDRLFSLSDPSREEILMAKPKDINIIVEFSEFHVAIPPTNNALDLAYAVTCHKFQGSECPVVIIPIPRESNNLMCKSWIYTALSRGKKLVVVVGPKDAFRYACSTPDKKRDTFLSYFVKKAMEDDIQYSDASKIISSADISELGFEKHDEFSF